MRLIPVQRSLICIGRIHPIDILIIHIYNIRMTYNTASSTVITVYRSGNSKVITIPPNIPVEIGEKFRITGTQKRLILEKVRDFGKRIKIARLEKYTGLFPDLTKGMGIEQLEKALEGVYE